jgi:LAO/AO transport system kinase
MGGRDEATTRRATPAVDRLIRDVRAGDRRALAKAITLVESTRADHQAEAQRLLDQLLPHTGRPARIGITARPAPARARSSRPSDCI